MSSSAMVTELAVPLLGSTPGPLDSKVSAQLQSGVLGRGLQATSPKLKRQFCHGSEVPSLWSARSSVRFPPATSLGV